MERPRDNRSPVLMPIKKTLMVITFTLVLQTDQNTTAVSRKVVLQNRKSERENADIEAQLISALEKEAAQTLVFMHTLYF